MTIRILPCKNTHPDFVQMVGLLDQELNKRYGNLQKEYDQHNLIEELETAVVGYINESPVACGCFKPFDEASIEIKRMFVRLEQRRKGYSVKILNHLETWGKQLGCRYAVLETGKGQPEAIHLYQKCGYQVIENYGPYIHMSTSVCMKKQIN